MADDEEVLVFLIEEVGGDAEVVARFEEGDFADGA